MGIYVVNVHWCNYAGGHVAAFSQSTTAPSFMFNIEIMTEPIVEQNKVLHLYNFDEMPEDDLGMGDDQSLRAIRTEELERRKSLRSAARR